MAKRILDKDFKYVPAVKTDIRKTFDRLRREQAEAHKNVTPIKLPNKRFKSMS